MLILPAAADDSFTFNFQGRLNNADGDPVPDGDIQMTFSIYSDSVGGDVLWSESHSAVPVQNGLFGIDLGSVNPCSLNVNASPDIYLAVQIGSDVPMARRFRITASPHSAVARRIYGDLETGHGRLLLKSAEGDSTFRLNSADGLNSFQIGAQVPPDPWSPAIEMKADAATQTSNFRLVVPPDPWAPAIEMKIDAPAQTGSIGIAIPPDPFAPAIEMKADAAAQTNSIRLGMPPDPFAPAIEMKTDALAQTNSFRLGVPTDPWTTAIEMKADAATQSNSIRLGVPPDPWAPAIEMKTDAAVQTSSIRLGVPPDPFAPAIEMKADAATQSNIIRMSIPPDPFTPAVEISASSAGGGINLYDTIGRRMGVEPTAWNPGLSLKLYQAIEEPADRVSFDLGVDASGPKMQFFDDANGGLKITSSADGTSMKFIHDGSEFMGVDPVPWHAGGDLTMRGPSGGETIVLSSLGTISIGTNSTSNILTIQRYSPTDPIADGWTTYSSRRWKTNIEPLKDPLAKVLALRGVSYDWKETGKHDIGLIAEEVGEVVPEVVAYEENGKDAQSIDYARLTALLIEAVKEQQKTIEEMKSEISDLKAQSREHVYTGSNK